MIGVNDSLGHPNLDSLAITKSHITPFKSTDLYRFGKSLRKKGLDLALIFERLRDLEAQLNIQLNLWLENIGEINLSPFPSKINERRYWRCKLLDGEASIPCGGTHIKNFSSKQKVIVSLSKLNECEIVMNTKVLFK